MYVGNSGHITRLLCRGHRYWWSSSTCWYLRSWSWRSLRSWSSWTSWTLAQRRKSLWGAEVTEVALSTRSWSVSCKAQHSNNYFVKIQRSNSTGTWSVFKRSWQYILFTVYFIYWYLLFIFYFFISYFVLLFLFIYFFILFLFENVHSYYICIHTCIVQQWADAPRASVWKGSSTRPVPILTVVLWKSSQHVPCIHAVPHSLAIGRIHSSWKAFLRTINITFFFVLFSLQVHSGIHRFKLKNIFALF